MGGSNHMVPGSASCDSKVTVTLKSNHKVVGSASSS